jgi:hypothetical protein
MVGIMGSLVAHRLRAGWLVVALGVLALAIPQSARAQSGDQVAGPANSRGPLAIYYGNTVVCGLTHAGNDLCHVWFYPNGKMVIFDQGGLHPAHYKVFSYCKSGAISIASRPTMSPARWAR